MTNDAPDLAAAYDLTSPAASKRLYADWAKSYDLSFAAQQSYHLPFQTAQAFVTAGGLMSGKRGPVLDAGAGTGLCGQALSDLGVSQLEATDISADMLAEATKKNIYRAVIEADLLRGIPVPDGRYQGVVSSGTFTHGHIGPEAFPELLRVAERGAQFALSINKKFYHLAGFETAFAALEQDGKITGFSLPEVSIYGAAASAEHRHDTAFIALFNKA
ncbi:class I SAM-dependent DNA methyltransferase [Pseudophaeobacter leonis]|uniref:class I SAM-dependent DNA methyltransferase n=1 Tax=Pseudophaeobacter leonis TaxID=1144477 RepID=UPI0009F4992A|nr:class I SAM-dependent methyltransferase [Pseudophaeobacter leonis]